MNKITCAPCMAHRSEVHRLADCPDRVELDSVKIERDSLLLENTLLKVDRMRLISRIRRTSTNTTPGGSPE